MADLLFSRTTSLMLQHAMSATKSMGANCIDSMALMYGLLNTPENSEENAMSILENYLGSPVNYSVGGKPNVVAKTISNLKNKLNFARKGDSSSKVETKYVKVNISKDKETVLPLDEEVFGVFKQIHRLSTKYKFEEVEPIHFIVAAFQKDLSALENFFYTAQQSYNDAKEFFHPDNVLSQGNLPVILKSFMYDMNVADKKTYKYSLSMDPKYADDIWKYLQKRKHNDVIILGEPGVGKRAIVEKIVHQIVTKECPKCFESYRVIEFNLQRFNASVNIKGDLQDRIRIILEFLNANPDVILYVDEILRCEMTVRGLLFDRIIDKGSNLIIGAGTEELFKSYNEQDASFLEDFEFIRVDEPDPDDVFPMIEKKLKALEEFHGVSISKELVEYVVQVSYCFSKNTPNPFKTLDTIDSVMVLCKSEGKTAVEKCDVIENFNYYIEEWNYMEEKDKKNTAYHEVGHYIMAKASGRLVSHVPIAISILPSDGRLGVTALANTGKKMPINDKDYYIDFIAFYLGGRVAEEMKTNLYTAGASSDTYKATKMAETVVMSLNLEKGDNMNRMYFVEEGRPMFTDEIISTMEAKMKELLEEAYKRAEEILDANKDLLEALTEALMEQHVMCKEDIDKVWNEVVDKRSK